MVSNPSHLRSNTRGPVLGDEVTSVEIIRTICEIDGGITMTSDRVRYSPVVMLDPANMIGFSLIL